MSENKQLDIEKKYVQVVDTISDIEGLPKNVSLEFNFLSVTLKNLFGMNPSDFTDWINTARVQLDEKQKNTFH